MNKKISCAQNENNLLTKAKTLIASEENKKNAEFLESLDKKYCALRKKYIECFTKWNEKTSCDVSRYEYAKGGATIHRGFYSPSMMDLVTAGLNRGRLLKMKPKKRNNTHTYFFDKQNRLIRVDQYDEVKGNLVSVEFLEYEVDKVLSFKYDMWDKPWLHFISECQMDVDGKSTQYETALFGIGNTEHCQSINVEIYNYCKGGLIDSLIWYRYIPAIPLVSGSKYTFSRDAQGYLSTFTVTDKLQDIRLPSFCVTNSKSHKVLVKTK